MHVHRHGKGLRRALRDTTNGNKLVIGRDRYRSGCCVLVANETKEDQQIRPAHRDPQAFGILVPCRWCKAADSHRAWWADAGPELCVPSLANLRQSASNPVKHSSRNAQDTMSACCCVWAQCLVCEGVYVLITVDSAEVFLFVFNGSMVGTGSPS